MKVLRIFMWFYHLHWDRNTIYPSPNVKLPVLFENFKNTSKVVLSLFTAFYKKCYNLASTIYTYHYSHFAHVNNMALIRMVYYETSPPRWNSPCRGEGVYSPRSFNQSASTRRAQLSVTVKVVRSTDPLNHTVKTWVNTDKTKLERSSLVKAPLSV